ncbi:hypothetical protein Tco_1298708 [Tanacetum coccineum]
MGNCIKKDSGEQWGGEYWGSSPARSLLSEDPSQEMCFSTDPFEETGKKEVLAGNEDSGDRSKISGEKREVKIKISRKELERLLSVSEVQGLTVQQVLNLLINGGDDGGLDLNQRSWKPALQSIPE